MARRVSQYLKVQALQTRVPRLESIRSRILVLAVLGALVPAAVTLGVAYRQNRRALEEQLREELSSESAQAARALSNAVKDRLLELRVYAGSDEVSASLSRFAMGQGSIPSMRLREYLRSLHEKVPEYTELMVLDAQGRVLASSSERAGVPLLPADWQRAIRIEHQLIGGASRDGRTPEAKLLVGVPVLAMDGRLLGAFAASMSLASIQGIVRDFAAGDAGDGQMYVLTDSGAVVASALPTRGMPRPAFRRLLRVEHSTVTYDDLAGVAVIGALERVPQLPWVVVAERPADVAFAQVHHFRDVAILAVVLVLLVVAVTAFRLGQVIVRPLERLTQGAAVVAMGDLDIDLPPSDRGEVGALTTVFNHMVGRLREGREALDRTNAELVRKNAELERLSVTDGLTGLTNHRALMQRLDAEALRSHRTERPFVFMMADVDHFKKYNDDFGHPAGDEVLKRVAAILDENTRDTDCVARYGGEEFAMLLPETDSAGALEVAERIRTQVEAADFPGRRITLSIGVAEFPDDASEPSEIISAADQALYVAKEAGRNQVVSSRRARRQKLPASSGRKATKKKD